MPGTLTGTSPSNEIAAVAQLVADVGIGVEMEYGCSASGAYGSYAMTTTLPTYFGYKTPTAAARSSYSDATVFFALMMAELNASPPRPMMLTVETTNYSAGHALVIDGYQTATGEMAHLNLGWGASYQGYYNINSNWSAGGYTWSANSQVIYLGLAPAGPQQALTTNLTGAGTGVVTSTPAGISCGTTCVAPFDANSTVTLSAAASTGSHFVAWGGDCNSTGAVVLSADRTCTAQFDLDDPTVLPKAVDSPWLSISVEGPVGWFSETTQTYTGGSAAQSGHITDSQSSSMMTTIVGPATLSFYWKVSSESGYDFLSLYVDNVVQPGRISGEVGWTPVSVTLGAGTHTVRWEYAKDYSVSMGSDAGWVDDVIVSYPLTVSTAGNGSGTVISVPAGISCPGTCTASFAALTPVTLSETPASGAIFTNWTGACADMGACGVPMSGATSVGAVFQSAPVYRRYFAEGAGNSFFDTRFALLNANASTAHVTMRFLRDDGVNFSYLVEIPPATRRTVDATDVPNLTPANGFSTIVESDVVVVVDRTMSWDSSGFGAHAEMSIAAPAQTWYLAEGSTLRLGTVNGTQIGFSLYHLVENPNSQATTVEITYLLPGGAAPVVKDYTVGALTRRTIYVNGEDARLASTDVSAIVSSLSPSLPIIVERALYLNSGGTAFGAGSDSAGATTSSLDWFLAEGATGPAFDEVHPPGEPERHCRRARRDVLADRRRHGDQALHAGSRCAPHDLGQRRADQWGEPGHELGVGVDPLHQRGPHHRGTGHVVAARPGVAELVPDALVGRVDRNGHHLGRRRRGAGRDPSRADLHPGGQHLRLRRPRARHDLLRGWHDGVLGHRRRRQQSDDGVDGRHLQNGRRSVRRPDRRQTIRDDRGKPVGGRPGGQHRRRAFDVLGCQRRVVGRRHQPRGDQAPVRGCRPVRRTGRDRGGRRLNRRPGPSRATLPPLNLRAMIPRNG